MAEIAAIAPRKINPPKMPEASPLIEIPEGEIYQGGLSRLPIQRKLSVGSVDDPAEDEADSMADKVMRMPETSFLRRKCEHCEEEEKVQRRCDHCEEEERVQRKPFAPQIQQSTGHPMVQRNVGSHSSCAPNVQGAPADPITDLQAANTRAISLCILASSLLSIDAILLPIAGGTPSSTLTAYQGIFGNPSPTPGPHGTTRFRNRFTDRFEHSLIAAHAGEMEFLSHRFDMISRFLSRNITYKCPGTHGFHVGTCAPNHCHAGDFAHSCDGGMDIAICHDFWGLTEEQRATVLIHEALHILLSFPDHDTGPAFAHTFNQRAHEPQCFANLAANIAGVTAHNDPSCP